MGDAVKVFSCQLSDVAIYGDADGPPILKNDPETGRLFLRSTVYADYASYVWRKGKLN